MTAIRHGSRHGKPCASPQALREDQHHFFLMRTQGVTFALGGAPQDLQRIADHLATVGNAHLVALVRHAARTPVPAAGGPMASVCVPLGQAGVPHALIEAARGAGLELDRSSHDLGPEEPIDPEG